LCKYVYVLHNGHIVITHADAAPAAATNAVTHIVSASAGLLFDVSTVAEGWIRLGGVLFATFGLQYLGAALLDWRLASSSSSSCLGVPDMPFRPASPHSPLPPEEDEQQQQQQQQQQQHAGSAAAAAAADATAGDGHGPLQSMGGSSSSSRGSVDGGGGSRQPQLQPAGAGAAATATQEASSSSSSSSSSRSASLPCDDLTPLQQQLHKAQHQKDSAAAAAAAAVHNPPASWLYSSNGFYEASVWSRLVLAALFCGLVALRHCGPGLLLLAALNVMGALGMLGALKKQWMLHVMGDMPNEMLMLLL
jgi:hypothetical protein